MRKIETDRDGEGEKRDNLRATMQLRWNRILKEQMKERTQEKDKDTEREKDQGIQI